MIQRARALTAVLAVVVLVGLGAMVLQAREAQEAERNLRHQLVAERAFDELEQALNTLIETEEQRPFLEWRELYEPAAVAGNALVRSPLADVPSAPILAYFQFEPDGRLTTPHGTPSGEVVAATSALSGWGETPAAPATSESVMVRVEVPRAAPVVAKPAPEPQKVARANRRSNPRQLAQEELPVDNDFNNAAMQRQSRSLRNFELNVSQIATFEPPQQEALVQPPEPEPEPEPLVVPSSPSHVWVPVDVPAASEPALVDVVVTPFEVTEAASGDLVMARTVQVGRKTWVQGLVVDREQLHDSLDAVVVKEGLLTLGWTDAGPPLDYAYDHVFAAPFESMEVTANLAALPDDNGAWAWLLPMSGLLALSFALGLLAVYRMIANSVALAEQRTDFVSAVTHELKSPLTSIRMYSEMLESGMVPTEERKTEYYRTIRLESERLARLVDDVLTFAKMERGMPAPSGETGTVGEVVDDVVRFLRPQAEHKGASLLVDVDAAARDVRVDRDALTHVITNLVDNAVKFSVDAADRTVVLQARRVEERVEITVRDHGPGVPTKLLRRIFQPFVRGERELQRKTKGTGIGLALVDGLVDQLGGEVDARNHPEGGLEVTVALPAA